MIDRVCSLLDSLIDVYTCVYVIGHSPSGPFRTMMVDRSCKYSCKIEKELLIHFHLIKREFNHKDRINYISIRSIHFQYLNLRHIYFGIGGLPVHAKMLLKTHT